MSARHRKTLRALGLGAILAGCAPIPALTFVTDVDSGTFDATTPGVAEDAGGVDDEGAAADSATTLDLTGDDASDGAATIKCGSTMVANCAACSSGRLRCKRGALDECVSDCATCGPSWLPCFHCPNASAFPRGQCLPVGASGQVACAKANLCPCSVDTDCPPMSGAAQTCDVVNGRKGCLTCGTPTTAGVACASASGTAGVCQVQAGHLPSCN